jgi:LysM repeat protein
MIFLFVLYSLSVASPVLAATENQIWKVRPGDSLETISMTLEIPKDEIKKHNPGISETNLQIGQNLKLPLLSYIDSKRLEEDRDKSDRRISDLETRNRELEKRISITESQLAWQPLWLWGFWVCFGIIVFIVAGACWIFRKTHPRVFDHPYDRSIRDLRESQRRLGYP